MRLKRARSARAVVWLLAACLPHVAGAASHDIDILTEHLPESGQDARNLSLPWPEAEWTPGTTRFAVQMGYVATGADALRLDGPLVALSLTRGLSERWALAVLGFYDDLTVGGDPLQAEMTGSFLNAAPVELPALAKFTDPRGSVRHWGAGVEGVWALSDSDARNRWSLFFGLVFQRLELDGFELDYRLLDGADAGATGILDRSSQADFVTPVLGLQQLHPMGERIQLITRFSAGIPLPAGDFDGRLTGPGFDLSTANGDGTPGKIGDGFVGFGLGLRHPPSGLEFDLGATLFYPAFQMLTHDGVDRAYTVQLSWHSR